MKDQNYKTVSDLLKYSKKREYPFSKTLKIYEKLSRKFYKKEAETGNDQDLFKLNSKTESKLIELCINEIKKEKNNQNP